MLNPVEIIRKKRDKHSLSPDELQSFFSSYLKNEVKDYQASALLMAIALNGMSREETATLTKIMRDSGTVLTWKFHKKLIVDKHSTGGVGDKTSLIILPLCALEGVKVPMMSGRGLGHTGGTLDKLEAIPGTNVRLPIERAKAIVEKHGGVFIGQTEHLAPLDKQLYSLRDVTGTVESIPLITASILSKKTAEGIGSLVMDVKHGSGAFMEKEEDATKLAESLAAVGKECGLHIRCILTNMNSPLGRTAGNNLEVIECLDVLSGKGPPDTKRLSIELAAEMVHMTKPDSSLGEISERLEGYLEDGQAFGKFRDIIEEQGGDVSVLDDPKTFVKAPHQKPVLPLKEGAFVESIDVRALGMAVVALGGGRKVMSDTIDPSVGLSALKQIGEPLGKQEPLAIVHASSINQLEEAEKMVQKAYKLGGHRRTFELITKRI